MIVYKVLHSDMMGIPYKEEYYNSKNKAKKALRRMLRDMKHKIVDEEDVSNLSRPVVHEKPFGIRDNEPTYKLMVELWYKCSYEYDEWDTTVHHLHIEKITVL